MSGLPPKPDFVRTPDSWPEPGDDRRYGGRTAPMAARSRRDDRERNQSRGHHHPRSSPPRSRSPHRGRERESTYDNHRDYYESHHRDERARGERGWEPDRRAPDRRDDRDWVTRDDHPVRGRGRGRGRGAPRRGYDKGSNYRGSWRGRDSEHRGRSRDYDQNHHHDRRRFDDRDSQRLSTHRPPCSPRRDSRERRLERHSYTRSPSRRSSSPRRHSRSHSPDGSTYRPSYKRQARDESGHSPNPPSAPQSHRSDDKQHRSQSYSPRPARKSSSSGDIKAEPTQDEKRHLASPTHSLPSIHNPDEKTVNLPASLHVKAEPDDDMDHIHLKVESVPDDEHLNGSPASSTKVKDEPADRDAEGDFKMRDRSPDSPHCAVSAAVKVKSPSTPVSPAKSLGQTVPEESPAEIPKQPTAPYLPPFPRREPRERLGGTELSQIEAIEASRARVAAEYVQISKAVRRALHELDLTSMDLRAAQSRREHAENQRKKAAAGFLDIDAEFSVT